MRQLTKIEQKIIEILDRQYHKGMKTYGQTLDDCPDNDYDWNTMTIEELVDALSYQVKENYSLAKKMKIVMNENSRYKAKMEQIVYYVNSIKQSS
jgi:hypothetical protein